MPVSEQLLEILVCPACRAKVELKPDGSALKCVALGHRVYRSRRYGVTSAGRELHCAGKLFRERLPVDHLR